MTDETQRTHSFDSGVFKLTGYYDDGRSATGWYELEFNVRDPHVQDLIRHVLTSSEVNAQPYEHNATGLRIRKITPSWEQR